MIRVLVTGAGGGVGQGIIKSLRLITDLDIYIVTADMSELASGLYGGDYSYLVPAASHKLYFAKIRQICIVHAIDFYFPGTDVELINCANHANEFKTDLGVNIIISPLSVITIADDKLKTVEFLQEHHLSYPITLLPHEVEWSQAQFPLIIKPRVGCRSIGVHLVYNLNQAKMAIDSLQSPIVQEHIEGYEYTCTIAICQGVVSDVLCLRRELRSGDTFRAFPEHSLVIEDYVREIAIRLGISGSCNFQLRVSEAGVPKLFEINSRFSGTTPFCAHLGFNPVEFCLKAQLGLPYQSHIDYNKVVLRHWTEIVLNKQTLENIKHNLHGKVSALKVSNMQYKLKRHSWN